MPVCGSGPNAQIILNTANKVRSVPCQFTTNHLGSCRWPCQAVQNDPSIYPSISSPPQGLIRIQSSRLALSPEPSAPRPELRYTTLQRPASITRSPLASRSVLSPNQSSRKGTSLLYNANLLYEARPYTHPQHVMQPTELRREDRLLPLLPACKPPGLRSKRFPKCQARKGLATVQYEDCYSASPT